MEYRQPDLDAAQTGVAGGIQQCIAALKTLCSALGQFHRGVFSRYGLTATQAEATYHLVTHGPMPSYRLADLLGVSTSAVTPLVDRLERGGFLERRAYPQDRRVTLLAATATGDAAVAQALPVFEEHLLRAGVDFAAITPVLEELADVLGQPG